MKTTCQGLEEQIVLWTAGLLSEAESRVLEAHLSGCERCRAVAEREQAIAGVLDDLVHVHTRGSVWRNVAMEVAQSRRAPRGRWIGVAAATAAALAVTILLWVQPNAKGLQVRSPEIRMARLNPVEIRTPVFQEGNARVNVQELKPNVVWITMAE